MIVLNNNESTIRDSAQELLEDLVRRNMVISQKDMWLQELCLSKAKDENFLQIVKVPISTYTINAQPPSRSRRLSVHSRNALHILIHGKSSKNKLDLFAYTISSRLGEFGVAKIIRSKRSKSFKEPSYLPASTWDSWTYTRLGYVIFLLLWRTLSVCSIWTYIC